MIRSTLSMFNKVQITSKTGEAPQWTRDMSEEHNLCEDGIEAFKSCWKCIPTGQDALRCVLYL